MQFCIIHRQHRRCYWEKP